MCARPGEHPFGVRLIQDLPDLRGKSVLVRATLDRPLCADRSRLVPWIRFRRLADTILVLQERGATVTVLGNTSPSANGDTVLGSLTDLVGPELAFVSSCGLVEDAASLRDLADTHDAFVNESFQWSYLALPSLTVPAMRLPAVAGVGLEHDLRIGWTLLHNPSRPYTAVLGGADSLLRLHGLQALILRADDIVVGGAMSLPLLAAVGRAPARGLSESVLDEYRDVIGLAGRVQHQIHLPVDLVVRRADGSCETVGPEHADRGQIVDIGPETSKRFGQVLHGADTVVWMGALSMVGSPVCAQGTLAVADRLNAGPRRTMVVGGDALVNLLATRKLLDGPTQVVTATDSFLELLKNADLPALAPLRA